MGTYRGNMQTPARPFTVGGATLFPEPVAESISGNTPERIYSVEESSLLPITSSNKDNLLVVTTATPNTTAASTALSTVFYQCSRLFVHRRWGPVVDEIHSICWHNR